jgi:hypothetical protein
VDEPTEKRLDQLAQASCGCWVDVLSELRMAKLLDAIVCVDEGFADFPRMFAGRS